MTAGASGPAPRPVASALGDALRAEALRLGFDAVGICSVAPSEHAAFYEQWIEAGSHGSMSYLARPDAVERRIRPVGFASAVVVALNYYTPDRTRPPPRTRPAASSPATHGVATTIA
jgi:epoxyqueuosine reductase QueG